MKGKFFQKPFEFSLNIEGESWSQGQTVSGTLTARNLGTAEAPLEGVQAVLAYASLSDVRKKSADAFEVRAAQKLEGAGALAPQAEKALSWSFPLDRNCPITEKSASLFLVYGQGEATPALGQLQLAVLPAPVIQGFLDILRVEFRFVIKSQKSSKGFVETKLAPPSAREFAALEQLAVACRFEGESLDTLKVRYEAAVKTLEATASAMDLKKGKKTCEHSFSPAQYLRNGRLDQERLEQAIRDALGELGLRKL